MPLGTLLLASVLFAPAAAEPLSIKIETDQPGIIEYDKSFNVVLTNTTDKPIKLWKQDTKQGYYQLSFQFINARTGEKHQVHKLEIIDDEYWKLLRHGDDQDIDTVSIAPKATMKVQVNFDGFTWGHSIWLGLPSPNADDPYRLTVQCEAKPSPDAAKQAVWTGKVASAELTIKYVAAKLKTPHQYLQNGYPEKAIAVMKSDPSWVNKEEDRYTPLHQAARFGHLEAVRWLLNNGANVNAKAENDFTPLHLSEDPEIIALILQKKPDLTLDGVSGSAFHRALERLNSATDEADKKKCRKIVDLYLKAGTEYDLFTAIHLNDLNQVQKILAKSPQLADNFQNSSPLRTAASLGRTEICKYLLDNFKVDVNDFERGVGYPIIKEALAHPKVVKLLIDHKVDLKRRITWQGGRTGIWIIGDDATALHHAADDGVPETITLLLDAGVDPFALAKRDSIRDDRPNQTALEVAAIFGKADNAQAILQHPSFKTADAKVRQALLNKCLVTGSYSSWLARDSKRQELIKVLLAHGADPLAKVDDRTAIQGAVECIHPDDDKESEARKVIALLREKGANLTLYGAVALGDEAEVNRLIKLDPKCVNDRRSDGYPALHFAIASNQKNIVVAILKAGCDVHIRNQSESTGGKLTTPLHAAVWWRRMDLVKLLIEAGADVNARDERKTTPLHDAAEFNSLAIAELLLQKGADPDARDRDNKTPLDWLDDSKDKSPSAMKELFEKYRQQKKP